MTNVQKIRDAYNDKQKAEEYLEALKELLHRYRTQSNERGCPICDIPRGCDKCPWKVLTGASCLNYRDKHFPKSEVMTYTSTGYFNLANNKAYRQIRMRQLPKWIFAYERALEDWK